MRYRMITVLLLLLVTLWPAKPADARAETRTGEVEIYEDTCAQLLFCGDRYRIKLFHYRDGRWNEAAETGQIQCHGVPPSISLARNGFYIRYTEPEYVAYRRNRDNLWRLSLFYYSSLDGVDLSISFYQKGIFVADFSTPVGKAFWLFGEPALSTRLEDFQPALLPRSVRMASRLVDTSGWGVLIAPKHSRFVSMSVPIPGLPCLARSFMARRSESFVRKPIGFMCGFLSFMDGFRQPGYGQGRT